MAVAGMNHHAGLLVQHKHIVILMNYVQRNILRKNLQPTSLIRHDKSHHIARTDDIVGLHDPVVHAYIFRLDCQLDTVTGGVFHMRCKILVHTHRDLPCRNVETIMLEHLLLLVLISHLVPGLERIEILYRILVKVHELLIHLL